MRTIVRALGIAAMATSLVALAYGAQAAMLGDGARVNAFRRKFIAPAASGKFALLKPQVFAAQKT